MVDVGRREDHMLDLINDLAHRRDHAIGALADLAILHPELTLELGLIEMQLRG